MPDTLPADRPALAPTVAAGRHVALALSGGVDSAVALLILRARGADVRPVFVKSWDEDDAGGHCPAAADLADAERVCHALGVTLSTLNLSAEYWSDVFEPFLDECRRARTPNPDVACNRAVKFGALLDIARDRGADRIATGHYARKVRGGGRWRLLRGRDPDKDQSYFLHRLDQDRLGAALFPLGDLDKHRVRAIAREAGLAVHAKRDSTGICFVGERPYAEFLSRWLSASAGPVLDTRERVVGRHRGLPFYTVGQRRGLGIGGRRDPDGRPWYVARKDPARNALVAVQGADHPDLHARTLIASDLHWIAGFPPGSGAVWRCTARIRHRQPDQGCRVHMLPGERAEVRFDAPQWAIAPGQAVVLYRDQECLGGGVIDEARP